MESILVKKSIPLYDQDKVLYSNQQTATLSLSLSLSLLYKKKDNEKSKLVWLKKKSSPLTLCVHPACIIINRDSWESSRRKHEFPANGKFYKHLFDAMHKKKLSFSCLNLHCKLLKSV